MFPNWHGEYESPYLLFVSTVGFFYYGGLYWRGESDDIRRIVTTAISEFGVSAGVQFSIYAAEGAVSDYFVGSLHLDHVANGMLFWLPNLLWNNIIQVGFYRGAERMRMDMVRVGMVFYRMAEVDWPSSGGFDDFIAYDFTTGTVDGYPSE